MYNLKFTVFILCIVGFLSACQSTDLKPNSEFSVNVELYHDEVYSHFESYTVETEEEVFAISDEMRQMVHEKLTSERDIYKRAKKLLKHLFSKDNINLAYKSGANLTATDAYHSHTANCMSLTIMAYALAIEAGLDVKFQEVQVPEYWVRNGEYNMLTGHVNLAITKPKSPNKMVIFGGDILQIDFDPYVVKKSFPKKVISKKTVLAMFYNNKGAQALVKKDYNQAYAYLKQATLVDPSFSSGWGNLGILYKLTRHNEFAEQAYRHAIAINSNNLTSLTNLSYLLRDKGNIEEALLIDQQLHQKRIRNPFYHALLADEAFFRGENEVALKHYQKAIKLDRSSHEFYFGLAKVFYKLNDITNAEKAMKKAIVYNKAKTTEQQYVAKLNFLKNIEVSH